RRLLASAGPGTYGVITAAEPSPAHRLTASAGVLHECLRLPALDNEAIRVWVRGLLHWEPPDVLLDWLQRETEGLPSRITAAVQGLQESGHLRRESDTWALASELPRATPSASGAMPATSNLPALLTSFVGRQQEMGEVRRLLNTSRLVTLAGPGGIGKTRLAIETGSDLGESFPGGVWLVELAPLADGSLITETIAAALGLSGEAEGTVEAIVIAHLQPRTLLLVLDNCEHLVEPAARVAEKLLLRCPRLSILSTSREPLGIAGESVFRVPPLSFPTPPEGGTREIDPADIGARFEAVRLFCSRAALTRPAFVLTPENFPAVARICRELDGIPLAVELAAARTNVLPVEQIAERLADRFRLLRGGSRTALPRQQTLKSLIDWSYDLLTSEEQRVLRALSVFAGGCTAEAAEAVAFEQGGEEPFDVLTRLVDKSLIQADLGDVAAAEPRYRLLETIRQYAQDRLNESGETARRRDLHAHFYARFVEAAEGELTGPRQREWLDRLDGELDNLRAALDHTREADPDLGLGLAGGLARFWQVRGHVIEGREWLSSLFSARQRQEPMVDPGPPYLKALLAAGRLAHLKHDSQSAIDYLSAADILAEHLNDAPSRVRALCQLGYPQHESGDEAAAAHSWQTGLSLSKQLNDPWSRAFALRAWAFQQNMLGQDEAALEAPEESLRLFRGRGDVWMTAHTLWRLGYTRMWRRGDHRTAAALLREGRDLWAGLREWMGVGHILAELGWALYFEGDAAGSRQAFEELLARATDRHDGWGLPTALHHLGKLAQLQGEYEKAEGFLRRIFSLDANDWVVANHTPWVTQTLGLIDVLNGRERRAREWLWEAISQFRNRSDELGIAVSIQNLARLKVRSNPEVAAALFAWASADYVRQGWVLAERLHPESPGVLRTVRAALGERGLLMARSTGVKLSVEEALAMALEEGRELPANLTCR
ncbi:MAG: ATP-binding protein, partial [Actinomycetota bacterium]